MKKLLFILLIFPLSGFGQVGINTNNPKQTLHVAGPEAKVRIDGLSEQYNPDNLGSRTTTRVYVNPEGDLVLGDLKENIKFILDAENYIPDDREVKVVQTGTGDNFTKLLINSYTFPSVTMEDDGIMEINYSLSWYIRRNNSAKLSDGGARTVRTIVYIQDANTGLFLTNPETGEELTFAITGQFYSNNDEFRGADGYFYNTGVDYIPVPAGEYRVIFGALVGGYSNSNVFGFFGGQKDQLQVIAHY